MRLKIKIRTKILSGFLLLIILIVAVAFTGISGMALARERYGLIMEKNMPAAAHIFEIRSKNEEQMAAIRAYLLYRDEKYRNEFLAIDTYLDSVFKEIEQYISTAESAKYMKESNEARIAYSEICRKIMDMIAADSQSDISAPLNDAKLLADQIEEISNQWIELSDKENASIIEELHSTLDSKSIAMNVTVAISVLLGIVTGLFISFTISNPIKALTRSANAIAEGDLLQPVRSYRTGDETELLSESFIKMQKNLKELIAKISQAAQTLASSSQQLSASSQETSSSSQEMASTINQLAEGASSQARELENTSSIVNDMSDSLGIISENASAVSEVSSKVMQISQDGLEIAGLAIDKIKEIKASTNQAAGLVTVLGEESQRIGSIIDIIKGISDQTNLLALNAAIEAARAGEMGKGFAVVASEVRKLAEQSLQSTQEISELIGKIQLKTQQAVESMNFNIKNVDEGVIAVNNAESSFKTISSEAGSTAVQINELSGTVQQMATGSKEIARSIESIAAVSEETAASSEEITAASEEQTAAMEEVASSAQDLARLAEELQGSICNFKV